MIDHKIQDADKGFWGNLNLEKTLLYFVQIHRIGNDKVFIYMFPSIFFSICAIKLIFTKKRCILRTFRAGIVGTG